MRFFEPSAVIDSDVIINFARLRLLDRLFRLFDEIRVPKSVRRETRMHRYKRRTDKRFRDRLTSCNTFDLLIFQQTRIALLQRSPKKSRRTKSHLGESEAIAQASRSVSKVLLTDDRDATSVATQRGCRVYSTAMLLRALASRQHEQGSRS